MSIDLKKYRLTEPVESKKGNSLSSLLNKEIKFTKRKLSNKFKEHFYSELGLLLESGLDIQQALLLLSAEQNKGRIKRLTQHITTEVVGGRALSDVLEETSDFDSYEVYTLRIGEETGNLAPVAKELAQHFQRKQELSRQLIGVFAYPAFVLVVSFGVVYFMLNYVVPLFADVFKRFGAELPVLTRIIIRLSGIVKEAAPWFFLFLLVAFVILRVSRNALWYRSWSARIIVAMPIFGKMAHQLYLSRFCQAMHVLTRADVPLTHSFELTKKMIRFFPLEQACDHLIAHVSQGGSVAGAMDSLKVFPKRLVSLVKVGEEVNQLDMIFGKLASDLSRDVEHKSKTIGKLLEPVLILVIGVLVAFILIGMYLPLFEMSKLMK